MLIIQRKRNKQLYPTQLKVLGRVPCSGTWSKSCPIRAKTCSRYGGIEPNDSQQTTLWLSVLAPAVLEFLNSDYSKTTLSMYGGVRASMASRKKFIDKTSFDLQCYDIDAFKKCSLFVFSISFPSGTYNLGLNQMTLKKSLVPWLCL